MAPFGRLIGRIPLARHCANVRSEAQSFPMISAATALTRLHEGNRRFVANESIASPLLTPSQRLALTNGQQPYAIVLGCSDSRVPAELVFDQGFGELFVIRVAGNIVAPSQVGSVEFAAARFGTRLVVVMGHSQCGAVTAAVEEVLGRTTNESRNLRSIVDRLRPSVETVVSGDAERSIDALVSDAVRANVRASVDHLRHGSQLLEVLIQRDGLRVVGAEYSLESGVVTFFEED
jgi:carbonic anhydrase